jgi:NADH-quinone oxidoreductase subunit L
LGEEFNDLRFMGLPLLVWIPLFPLLGALVNLTLGRRLSRQTVHAIAIASVVASFGIVLYMLLPPVGSFQGGDLYRLFREGRGGDGVTQQVFTWLEVGSPTSQWHFKIDLAFRMDTLSAVMCVIVTFVGSLIHIYSTGYMANDPGYARFFGYLNLFTGAMLILVLGSSLPVMFIGWEGVGMCSYLLIGFWYENDAFATAGRKAFVVNRIGDFCFLLGMFLLFWAVKSLDFADLKSAGAQAAYVKSQWGAGGATVWTHERLAAAAGILLFIGACGKSAQIPLYVWLPDAMAGPTPVSALIHAATMVTAGVYMVCRLSFLYATSTTAMIVISVVGLLTALMAAFYAFAQTDMKKVLAYSTVSQLGFMFVAAGTGNWVGAIFHLGTHAFFKACLFLGAGSVMHAMEHAGSHTPGDITTMGGLRAKMPITRATFMVSCLAIAGIFPFAGFFSKDEILGGAWGTTPPGWPAHFGHVLWAGLLIGALGTAFYMWRLYFLVFGGEARSEAADHAHESPRVMTGVLVVLAFFATIIGFIGVPHLFEHVDEKTHEVTSQIPSAMHALELWLHQSVVPTWYQAGPIIHEASDSTTLSLMAIALVVAVLGIAAAWMGYGRGPSKKLQQYVDGPLHDVYVASKNKLWVDEIYDSIIVRPFRVLARGLYEIVDRFIIDTVVVNGSAFVVGLFGRVSRWVQNGQVQRYLVGVILGAAAVFLISDCRHGSTFDYHDDGTTLTLHARFGYGLEKASARVRWHLHDDVCDDDPKTPKTPQEEDKPDATFPSGKAGAQVTLCVYDHVSGKTIAVTRTIREETTP